MIDSLTPYRLAVLAAAVLATGPVATLVAQEFQVERQPGPYYVGDPVIVRVIAAGFASGSEPTCRWKGDGANGVTILGPHVSQSSRSFTQIINGRMTRRESNNYDFDFQVTADREGTFAIGQFEVSYDGKAQLLDGGTIQFSRLENDPDMRIAMSLPEGPVYAGQQVPITIRWSYAGDINAVQYAFANLQIRSPLFDQFRFKDEPARTQTTLTIATAKGSVEIGATVSKETLEGRECYVVTGQRTLIADKPSDYEAIPITCRTKKVVRWSRDLFGDLIAREEAPALAAGTPLTFTIKPLPLSNRPESFAGAVGSGFSIDVAADRSVVRVGDPITLTISVRGDGNLENVPLPQLSADNELSHDLFQIPAEQPAGTFDGKTKEFRVTIRVKEPSVGQIPAIAFSWFDPVKESYGTGRSKPIALQVTETRVVSAGDVVSAPKAGDRAAETAGPGNGAQADPSASGLSLVGANLAIERDVSRLAADATASVSPRTIAAVMYAVAAAIVLGGVVARSRARRDKGKAIKKARLRSFRRTIESARSRPPREAAEQIAHVMRQLLADCDAVARREADHLVLECENAIYAIGDKSTMDVRGVADRALGMVDRM